MQLVSAWNWCVQHLWESTRPPHPPPESSEKLTDEWFHIIVKEMRKNRRGRGNLHTDSVCSMTWRVCTTTLIGMSIPIVLQQCIIYAYIPQMWTRTCSVMEKARTSPCTTHWPARCTHQTLSLRLMERIVCTIILNKGYTGPQELARLLEQILSVCTGWCGLFSVNPMVEDHLDGQAALDILEDNLETDPVMDHSLPPAPPEYEMPTVRTIATLASQITSSKDRLFVIAHLLLGNENAMVPTLVRVVYQDSVALRPSFLFLATNSFFGKRWQQSVWS